MENKLSHRIHVPIYRPILVLGFSMLLLCCSQTEEDITNLTTGELNEIRSAVINRFNAMIKYAEAGELENILSHFDASGNGSHIDGGTRYATFQDMVDSFRANWKIKNQDYGIPDTKMFVLSPIFVTVTSTSIINTTSREGIVYKPRPWSVTTLWMLKDGEWKIHSFHQFTADPVPVEEKKEEGK
ncbi:MAG: hypothetical protein WD824_10315 [Cyclobacteriaceae bacterium]